MNKKYDEIIYKIDQTPSTSRIIPGIGDCWACFYGCGYGIHCWSITSFHHHWVLPYWITQMDYWISLVFDFEDVSGYIGWFKLVLL